jgi:pyruvate/2-oxoacid:ferredoxin oxidoreductase alpha subunit
MNEQFKELLARHVPAPAVAVRKDDQGEITARVTYTVSHTEMDALLLAVVQECANVVKYYYIRGGEPITPQHITRHFGVKE